MDNLSIRIITGEINCGKTTMLRQMLADLPESTSVSGIIADGIYDGTGSRKSGFSLTSIKRGEHRLLMDSAGHAGWQPVGRFWMDPAVMGWAAGEIESGLSDEILAIDEIGHLELERKGYYDVLNLVLRQYTGQLLLVVRNELLVRVCRTFGLPFESVEIVEPERRNSGVQQQ